MSTKSRAQSIIEEARTFTMPEAKRVMYETALGYVVAFGEAVELDEKLDPRWFIREVFHAEQRWSKACLTSF